MAKTEATHMPRLKSLYDTELKDSLYKDLKLENRMQVPKLEKIVVSVGLGKSSDDKRMLEVSENTITKITGQKPVSTYARKSIAGFKLREGQKIGLKVTLRGDKMYEFFDRFVNIVLPRVRDFRGVSSKSFDNQGNYSYGLVEQSVFPELSFEETTVSHGIEITIVTSTNESEHAKALLSGLGMPFEKEKR